MVFLLSASNNGGKVTSGLLNFQLIKKKLNAPSSTVPSTESVSHQRRQQQDFSHAQKLLEVIRSVIVTETDPSKSIAIVDTLQRLGIDYHFQEEIDSLFISLLHDLVAFSNGSGALKDLHDVALGFRLLRQQGYFVSPAEVFGRFIDENGKFRVEHSQYGWKEGMQALYEASFMAIEGEDVLFEARGFAGTQLESCILKEMEPAASARQTKHCLENPLRLTLPRYNIKFHIENHIGESNYNKTPEVLNELAKLDFTIVQSMHQQELKDFQSWWKELGLAEELEFARNQPVKWFMASLALLQNPRFSMQRVELAKPITFVYIIDDIYDNFAGLDELLLFTEAINRWDVDAIVSLPCCMKRCFMALYNTTDEISIAVMREYGWNPIHLLRRTWAKLCNAFLVEARWFFKGHSPSTEEYLKNGVISSGVPMVLIHLLALLGDQRAFMESCSDLDRGNNMPCLISSPATILRLWDDLGSAKDENQNGHDGSYVQYYMSERGDQSAESAREHVRNLIADEWKKLNEACLLPGSSFSRAFSTAALNAARMVRVIYSYDEEQRLVELDRYIHSLLDESIT